MVIRMVNGQALWDQCPMKWSEEGEITYLMRAPDVTDSDVVDWLKRVQIALTSSEQTAPSPGVKPHTLRAEYKILFNKTQNLRNCHGWKNSDVVGWVHGATVGEFDYKRHDAEERFWMRAIGDVVGRLMGFHGEGADSIVSFIADALTKRWSDE